MAILELEILVVPEMKPGTVFFQAPGAGLSVNNRGTKNPQVRVSGGAYQLMDDVNGSFNSHFFSLPVNTTVDLYYKDDDIPEKFVGRAYIAPLAANCFVDSAEVVPYTLRRKTDGRLTAIWGFGYNTQNNGKYQISVDGGHTFKPFPDTAAGFTNYTEFTLIQSPAIANTVVRRTDISCNYSLVNGVPSITVPPPVACTLQFDTPAFVKTNETFPDADNGTIRINIVPGTEQGTVQYQLKNGDGTVARPFQTSDLFTNLAPGTYRLVIKDDVCDPFEYGSTVGVLAYQSPPTEDAPSSTRDYINIPSFTRFRFLSGVTIDDFLAGGGILPPPDDEVIDPTPEDANLRITTGGDQRITTTGDRRITN